MLYFPATIYLLRINNRNTRTRYEICLQLKKDIKTTPRRHWRRSGPFVANFEHMYKVWSNFQPPVIFHGPQPMYPLTTPVLG